MIVTVTIRAVNRLHASVIFTLTVLQWQRLRHQSTDLHELRSHYQIPMPALSHPSPRTSKMPAIKREDSSRSPIASKAPAELHNRPVNRIQHVNLPILPQLLQPTTKPYVVAKPSHLCPSAYTGSSPRKYQLTAPKKSQYRHLNAYPPPMFSRLPSRLGSAMATTRVNKTTRPVTTTTVRSRIPKFPKITHLTKHLTQKSNATQKTPERMDERGIDGNDYVGGENFTTFPPIMVNGTNELYNGRDLCLHAICRSRRC